MYCRNFWDCFGSFFLFYIIKSGFFGVNGLPQVHRYGFYSVSAHFDPLRPPLGSLSDPRRHTLLSHGLCFKMHWKKTVHFSNSCQIAICAWNFKILDSFDIGKVRLIQIHRRIWCDFRRFWVILGDFGRFLGDFANFEHFQTIWWIFVQENPIFIVKLHIN